MPEVTLESEEWYVVCNWLREEENRLMYSLRSKSREWAFVHDLRREIERRQAGAGDAGANDRDAGDTSAADVGARDTDASDAGAADTGGIVRPVALSDRQVSYLLAYLRRRARRLLVRPWRTRERRDVRHLRDHLLESVQRDDRSPTAPAPADSRRRRG